MYFMAEQIDQLLYSTPRLYSKHAPIKTDKISMATLREMTCLTSVALTIAPNPSP